MCNFSPAAGTVLAKEESGRCFYCNEKLYHEDGKWRCPTTDCGNTGTDVRCWTCGKGVFSPGPRGITQCRACGHPVGVRTPLSQSYCET